MSQPDVRDVAAWNKWRRESDDPPDLREANLRWADLRWADLRWANLRWANLRGADRRATHTDRSRLSGVCHGDGRRLAHHRWVPQVDPGRGDRTLVLS